MKYTQLDCLGRFLMRPQGATTLEIIVGCSITSVHRRLTDLKNKGWKIEAFPVDGEAYLRCHGTPPLTTKQQSIADDMAKLKAQDKPQKVPETSIIQAHWPWNEVRE